MSAAAARQPTETEIKAHERHMAFHESIAEKAAALQAEKQHTPHKVAPVQTAPPAEVLSPQFPALSLPPMKKPWFSIVGVAAPPPLRVREIQDVVCEAYGFDLVELTSQRRTARVVRARQVAMYLARVMTGRSLPDIARRFGGRDHTTVLHAFRKIKALIDPANQQFDPGIASAVDALRTDLEARCR